MTDKIISLDDHKNKNHNKRLEKTVEAINRLASEGKVLVVSECRDGDDVKREVLNLDEVLKNYTDWGFSPGSKNKKGWYDTFYIPNGLKLPMFQDLYTLEFRSISSDKKQENNDEKQEDPKPE